MRQNLRIPRLDIDQHTDWETVQQLLRSRGREGIIGSPNMERLRRRTGFRRYPVLHRLPRYDTLRALQGRGAGGTCHLDQTQ